MPSIEHDEIQNWFLKQSKYVEKEKSIETHRADVVLANKFVIEIQCTPITIDEYENRNQKFIEAGFYPVWVLGKNFYEHTRRTRKRGQYIRLIEQIELKKHGVIFYHNKYNLFYGDFEYKWASGIKDSCKTKGWYRLQGPLTFNAFWGLIKHRMAVSVL